MASEAEESQSINDEATPTDWLVHQWVVAGLVSASAKFIPLPFVDDIVRGQCRRFVAARTLSTHCGETTIRDLKPYYGDEGGCVSGCLSLFWKFPLKLLLFPIRKIVAIVTSVRDVPLEIFRAVLLGRTLKRRLVKGPISTEEAARMRKAFDISFSMFDFKVVRAALADTASNVRVWGDSAGRIARQAFAKRKSQDVEIESDASIDATANEVQRALEQPEVTKLFAEFDARFDAAMQEL